MKFFTFGITDIGLEKQQNQDSYLIKVANTSIGQVSFAVICDGMGGLEHGEIASATVVKAFEDWFDLHFPNLIKFGMTKEILEQQWINLIRELNERISAYGDNKGISLGTTVCAILITQVSYYCVNVGDSRAYLIDDSNIVQITKDQSIVQRKIDMGIITEEQAHDDSERSVLLQCVGCSHEVCPDFYEGIPYSNQTYMLCSDGFRHEISPDEIQCALAPYQLTSIEDMEYNSKNLIELNKKREETDNITTVLVRTY